MDLIEFKKDNLIIEDKKNNISFIRKDWKPFIWNIYELKCKKDNISWKRKDWWLNYHKHSFTDWEDWTYTIYPMRLWIPIFIN
jgi:hypothetical protein